MDTPVKKNPCLQCLQSEVVKGLYRTALNMHSCVSADPCESELAEVETLGRALEYYEKAVKELGDEKLKAILSGYKTFDQMNTEINELRQAKRELIEALDEEVSFGIQHNYQPSLKSQKALAKWSEEV